MFNGVSRLGSELPLPSIVGVLGMQDGEPGTDRPRRSGWKDVPEGTEETSGSHQRLTEIQTICQSISIVHAVHQVSQSW